MSVMTTGDDSTAENTDKKKMETITSEATTTMKVVLCKLMLRRNYDRSKGGSQVMNDKQQSLT